MSFRALTFIAISLCFWLFSFLVAPSAFALTQVKISDLSYQECSAELSEGFVGTGSTRAANCFVVAGKVNNPTGKMVVDADVFGRIYDANGNPAMQNRNRIGSIEEIPPGVSDFQIRISVPANQPTPLQLKQFKASGFARKVRPYYY